MKGLRISDHDGGGYSQALQRQLEFMFLSNDCNGVAFNNVADRLLLWKNQSPLGGRLVNGRYQYGDVARMDQIADQLRLSVLVV